MKVCLFVLFTILTNVVAYADDDTIDITQYLREIRSKESAVKFATSEELLNHLQNFPPQEQVVIRNEEESAKICNEYFAGFFFWWSCKTDLNQKIVSKKVLEFAVLLSKTPNYEWTRPILMAAGSGYVDGGAFETFSTFVTVG